MMSLERELSTRLESTSGRYSISTLASFADFNWDGDATIDEVMSRDAVVVIDGTEDERRVVIQRIRGELRYWLTTERDPYAASRDGENELGILASLDHAVELCRESLDCTTPVAGLQTPRLVHGQQRGRRRE